MKNLKVVLLGILGVGGACAACCSIPLAGAFAALAGGASGALVPGPSLLVPTVVVVLAAAVGFLAWRKRRRPACPIDGSCGCR